MATIFPDSQRQSQSAQNEGRDPLLDELFDYVTSDAGQSKPDVSRIRDIINSHSSAPGDQEHPESISQPEDGLLLRDWKNHRGISGCIIFSPYNLRLLFDTLPPRSDWDFTIRFKGEATGRFRSRFCDIQNAQFHWNDIQDNQDVSMRLKVHSLLKTLVVSFYPEESVSENRPIAQLVVTDFDLQIPEVQMEGFGVLRRD